MNRFTRPVGGGIQVAGPAWVSEIVEGAREITRRTFLKRVQPYRCKWCWDPFKDPNTSHFKSKYNGIDCYYYEHSADEMLKS